MPRTISADMLAELVAAGWRPCLLLQAEFTSGWLYLWHGNGDKSWNGHTWQGLGYMGKISAPAEASELRADNVTIELSGIPSSVLSKVLGEVRPKYACKIWLGALNPTGAVIADPLLAFSGYLDVPTLRDGGDTCSISITVENRLIALQRVRPMRYTSASQAVYLATKSIAGVDRFFEHVPSVQDWNGVWGKASPNIPGGPGHPGRGNGLPMVP